MLARDGRTILSPSDLNDYVECEHLTTLSLEVARGQRPRPRRFEEATDLLRRKGLQHEAAYLERLQADGRQIVNVIPADEWDFETAARATAEAMRAGADVIYQATFVLGDWRGRADFLERVERPTALGDWGYEPVDAKLARSEKPTYVLQLCFYSEGIAAIQGQAPERMHVLLGPGERVSLRHADFVAYYRRLRRGFETAIGRAMATEPLPVKHCDLCEFREVCTQRWEQEDHLVLVAGMRRDQVAKLRGAGVPTLTRLAETPREAAVERLAAHTLDTLRDQAGLQLIRRRTGRLEWHSLDAEPGRGFDALPRPSPGDLIFDIEGDPFWEPARGLHFLLGLLAPEGEEWLYQEIWSHERTGEQRAFEMLIDLIQERRAQFPDLHVYHYGAYETTAIKQLMGAYATREDAVDDLLRGEVFVDLHQVVRQGLRAGVPGYSLKEMEVLAAFVRKAEVRSGTRAVFEYERWMETHEAPILTGIAAYNEEDCRATLALRAWLVAHRPEGARWFEGQPPREVDEERAARNAERETLRLALVESSPPPSMRWLAGELLEYHRREARPEWWWYYARRDRMTMDDLENDSEAVAKLKHDGRAPVPDKRSLVYTLRFPPQQHKLRPGLVAEDPATKESAGTIVSVDDAAGTLQLKRGPKHAGVALPEALIPGEPLATPAQQGALARVARSVLAGDGHYPAAEAILGRARPRFVAGAERDIVQTTDPREISHIAVSLDRSYLFIQGPPGTGKTWTGATIVLDLMRQGRRVGVTATSHKAIHNLLNEVEKAARAEGFRFRGLKWSSGEESEYDGQLVRNTDDRAAFFSPPRDVLLLAGTAWQFCREDADGGGGDPLVDTLVIDEAGQVALADAVAMATAARNVILLGDPHQLAQVSQGTHPEGTDRSVLEHLLGDDLTVPRDMGVFLERTHRMHPDICRFVSEVIYDRRLEWEAATVRRGTAFGTGLRYLPVAHVGNASMSPEEADCIAKRIREMVGAPCNTDGETRSLVERDFMVVAPYNAQVRCLRSALRDAGLDQVQVGTVDKFQGQQALVVFYSMATSTADDVPRNLEFLFSRNRLNVAVSRAKCLAYVVASPRLLESRARTVEQMRLINALCRFVEMAEAQ